MPRHGILPSNDGSQPRPFEKPALPFDSRTRALTRAAIAILVLLLAAWVARDFLVALTWAGVTAVLGRGDRHHRLADLRPVPESRLRRPVSGVGAVAVYAHDRSRSPGAHRFGCAPDRAGQRCFRAVAQSAAGERTTGSRLARRTADRRQIS